MWNHSQLPSELTGECHHYRPVMFARHRDDSHLSNVQYHTGGSTGIPLLDCYYPQYIGQYYPRTNHQPARVLNTTHPVHFAQSGTFWHFWAVQNPHSHNSDILWPKTHVFPGTLWCHQTWLLENPRTQWRFLDRKITVFKVHGFQPATWLMTPTGNNQPMTPAATHHISAATHRIFRKIFPVKRSKQPWTAAWNVPVGQGRLLQQLLQLQGHLDSLSSAIVDGDVLCSIRSINHPVMRVAS